MKSEIDNVSHDNSAINSAQNRSRQSSSSSERDDINSAGDMTQQDRKSDISSLTEGESEFVDVREFEDASKLIIT